MDELENRVTAQGLRRMVTSASEANMNMLRM